VVFFEKPPILTTTVYLFNTGRSEPEPEFARQRTVCSHVSVQIALKYTPAVDNSL